MVELPSTCVLTFKFRRVITPFDVDAARVGLVPTLYVVLLDGLVSLTTSEDVGVGTGVATGVANGVGVGVGVGVPPGRGWEAPPPRNAR